MELQGINIKITRRDENVPEVKRYIRTVEERASAIVIHYLILHHRLMIETVYNSFVGKIKSLNSNSNLKSNLDRTSFEISNLKM